MFDTGQRAAVEGAFKLAGYTGRLVTAAVSSEDERALLEPDALGGLRDVRTLEQIVQQVLGRKVFIVERSDAWGVPAPFE